MKVTVTRTETTIEVEGSASEIREGVPALLVPTLGTPALEATSDAPREAAVVIEYEEPEDVDEPSADVVPITRSSDTSRTTPYEAGDGVNSGELLEGGPFEQADDIPEAWRWVSDNGMTCHIRMQPGVPISMCSLSRKKIGARRLHDVEIPFRSTEVCEGCNAALVRARRAG